MERDLTTGSIGRNILKFTLFVIFFADFIWNGGFVYYWTI